jgi:hypothetical protein
MIKFNKCKKNLPFQNRLNLINKNLKKNHILQDNKSKIIFSNNNWNNF